MAQLVDLGLVAVVQMLARAKNLHRRNADMLDLGQESRGKAVIDVQVRREYVIHSDAQWPSAVASVRGSGAPSSQPFEKRMAATSPCVYGRPSADTRFTL